MKLCTTSTLLALAALVGIGCDHVVEPRGDGERKRVPPNRLERFDRRNQCKKGRTLDYQRIRNGGKRRGDNSDTPPKVEMGDAGDFSIDDADLEPVNVMSSRSGRIMLNGYYAVFPPMVFQSKQDESVTVVKDVNGRLISASKRASRAGQVEGSGEHYGNRGKKVDVVKLSFDTYVTIDADDLDAEQLKLSTAHGQAADATGHPNIDGRKLRNFVRAKKQQRQPEQQGGQRSLQVDYDVIDLDVVADHYFCSEYGGSAGAIAQIESIVVEASKNFEGFGVKLEVGTIVMDCNSVSDPVSGSTNGFMNGVQTLCGTDGALERFRTYYENAKVANNLNGDLAHLFYGYPNIPPNPDTGYTSVGCAYRGNSGFHMLCNQWGYNTGVDEMTWTPTLMLQGDLLAHEIGHNLHQAHINDNANLMNSWLCPACTDFNAESIATFQDTIANAPAGCVLPESYVPTQPPTPAPTTAAPTPAPQPGTPAPTPSPNCADSTNWFMTVGENDPQPLCEVVADPPAAGAWWLTTAQMCASYGSICPATCVLC